MSKTQLNTDLEWIFGYGSLMWRPGFDHVAQFKARLFGAHRSFCMRSVDHRGTYEKPGIVLGLVPGGSCIGMVFGVQKAKFDPIRAYLAKREWVGIAYDEVWRDVHGEDGQKVCAMTYLVKPSFAHYQPGLNEDEIVAIARDAHGQSGPNKDYIINTNQHLNALGIFDPSINRMAQKLKNDPTAQSHL